MFMYRLYVVKFTVSKFQLVLTVLSSSLDMSHHLSPVMVTID